MASSLQTLWNNRFLRPPPTISLCTPLSDKGKVTMVLMVLKEVQKAKEKQIVFSTEEFALCRIIYKLNSQLRSEKTLQFLKRIKVCLAKLAEIKVEKMVDNLLHILQQCNLMARSVYLPSQQMMEHLLVKLMGAKNLYKQTTRYCFTAYVHLKQQLSIGTLVPQNLTLMALISRLWVLAKTCLCNYTRWYGELYPCLEIFVPTVHPWLPNGVLLPNTIEESDDEPEPLDLYQSNAYQEKYMERVEPKKMKYFLFQRDIVEEDGEDESDDEDFNELSVTNDASQKTLSAVDRSKVMSLHKNMRKGYNVSEVQQTEISEDEGEPVSRVQHMSVNEMHQQITSEDEGELVPRAQHMSINETQPQNSSEHDGEPFSKTQEMSVDEIQSQNYSEDEEEPVSRTQQVTVNEIHSQNSSKDEGEPASKAQHMSRNETHTLNSRKDEGEPDSVNDQQISVDPQHPTECSDTDPGPSLNISKRRKIPKVKNDQGYFISGAVVLGNPEIMRCEQGLSHCETEWKSVPQVNINSKAVKRSSFEELITILNGLPLVVKEEKKLVQDYIKSLKKLRHESHKSVHPLRQNKKLKKARKLVMGFKSDLDQLRIVCQEKEEVKRRVKEQQKITNTPSKLVDGDSYIAPKPGKKRKQDFSCEEWGGSDGKKKRKKINEEAQGQIQDNFKSFSTSKEKGFGFLKLVKHWQKSVQHSSTVTLKGLKYDLSNPAKKRNFFKKLKVVKWKFLNRELTEEESIKAIDSHLISL